MLAAALMVAGTALQVWGQQNAARARAAEAERQGELDELQAQETLERAKFNEAALLRQEAMLQGEQLTGYAKAGIDVGSGSPILVMAQSIMQSRREIYLQQREAQFRAMMIREGAASNLRLAGEERQAANISSMGTILLAGYNYGAKSGAFDKNNGQTIPISETNISSPSGDAYDQHMSSQYEDPYDQYMRFGGG